MCIPSTVKMNRKQFPTANDDLEPLASSSEYDDEDCSDIDSDEDNVPYLTLCHRTGRDLSNLAASFENTRRYEELDALRLRQQTFVFLSSTFICTLVYFLIR